MIGDDINWASMSPKTALGKCVLPIAQVAFGMVWDWFCYKNIGMSAALTSLD